MKDLVIFGSGEIAEVAHYYFSQDASRKVAAFVVDAQYKTQDTLLDLPVVTLDSLTADFPAETYEVFIAMSFKKVNKLRQQKFEQIRDLGYTLASHVCSRAMPWNGFQLNPNTLVMEANVIQPYAKIGANAIIWSGNHIGHHSTIEDHCFLASHVVVSGHVTIGQGTFIGVNATIRDNVSIGRYNVIGAGTLILGNTDDESVFIGPATEKSRVPSSRLRSI
jgi:sugar O-acyltransferase (sialic acid O-acetyltransferase NeuD family)